MTLVLQGITVLLLAPLVILALAAGWWLVWSMLRLMWKDLK